MPRTDAELVSEVIEVDSSIDLDPFMEDANALVNAICVPTGLLTEPLLTRVETWLAGHLYAMRDKVTSSEAIGRTIITTWNIKQNLNLNQTRQGQTAMLLDISRSLSLWNERITNPPRGGVIPMVGGFHCEDGPCPSNYGYRYPDTE